MILDRGSLSRSEDIKVDEKQSCLNSTQEYDREKGDSCGSAAEEKINVDQDLSQQEDNYVKKAPSGRT